MPEWLTAVLVVAVLLITAGLVAGAFFYFREWQRKLEAREARLPDATRLEDVATRAGEKDEQLAALREKLRDAEEKIAARASAQQWLDEHQAVLDNLESDRRRQGELRTEVEQLEQKAARLTDRKTQLEKDAAAAEVEKERLKTQVQVLENELQQKTDTLKASRAEHATLQAQQAALKSEVGQLENLARKEEQLQQEVTELLERQRAVTLAVESAEANKKRLQDDAAKLTHRLEEQTAALETARTTHEDLQQQRAALKTEVGELETLTQRCRQLQDNVDKLTQRQTTLAGEVEGAEATRERLRAESEKLQETIDSRSEVAEQAQQRHDELAARRAGLEKQVAELEALAQRHQTLQQRAGELTGLEREMSGAVAELQQRRDRLQTEADTLAEEVQARTQARDEADSDCQTLEERRAALRQETAELEALAERHQTLEQRVTDLTRQDRELSATVAELEQRRDRLRDEIEKLTEEVQTRAHGRDEVRHDCQALEERRAALRQETAELEVMTRQQKELREEIATLSMEQRRLADETASARHAREETAAKLSEVEADLEKSRAALAEAKTVCEAAEEKRSALRTEVAELTVLQQTYQELRQKVTDLTERHGRMSQETAAAEFKKAEIDDLLAKVTTELEQTTEARESARTEVEALEGRRGHLKGEVAELEVLADRHHRLTEEVAQLAERHETLNQEATAASTTLEEKRDHLATTAAQLEEKSAQLAAARTEHEELSSRRGSLKGEVAELESMAQTHRELKQSVAELAERHALLKQEVAAAEFSKSQNEQKLSELCDDLASKQAELDRIRNDHDTIRDEHARLGTEVAELSTLLEQRRHQTDETSSRFQRIESMLEDTSDKLEHARRSHSEVSEEVSGLAARKDQLEKTIDIVGETLKELRLQAGYRGNNAGPLSELWRPALIKSEFSEPRDDDETACIEGTQAYLQSMGLRFPTRAIRAVHTSLKVADISPLLVLAGISGTGKSELARRFAEGMGMHFLNLPVQPRWDSPQDMFGFFNYLENQYRATELARALVQMDPFAREPDRGWQLPEEWEESLCDRMLLVLLDEMNLARVEYYFSEFLSRLEMRRGVRKHDHRDRRKAEITLEVGMHGATDPTMRLFVDTNVLFVGTMNEDETTQTLSDKVVDRSNVLNFGKPPQLRGGPRNGQDGRPERFLSYERWRSWLRRETDLPADQSAQVDRWIDHLNGAMSLIRKPFAFRTHQSIRSYAANYPDASDAGLATAMADQVEQKILTKFRGLDPNEEAVGQAIDRLLALVNELGDTALVDAIQSSRRDGKREHQFIFGGVDLAVPVAHDAYDPPATEQALETSEEHVTV